MLYLLAALALAQEPPPAPADAPVEDELPPIVKGPEILEYVQAPYPPEAEAQGLEGSVLLLIEIDETGVVTYAEVLQPIGHGFDEAALEAIKQFTFVPAEDTNGPTAVALEFEYGFVLDVSEVEGAVPDDVPEEPQELPVNLEGTVIEMATRKPLPEMAVGVMGTDLIATTDEEGRFELRGVPLGMATVQVARPGWTTKTMEIEVLEGQVQSADIWVKNESYAEAAVGVYHRNKDEVTRRTISMSEAKRIPGTFGDPIRVIQNLPGAARSPFSTGLLIIRGANPEDTGVYVDGIRIPLIYHLGGFASVINPDLIESVDYLPGGYGVQYGRTIGGAVDVTTKKESPEQPRLAWSTDILDSGGVFEARLGPKDTHHVGIAGRASYVDYIIRPIQESVGTRFITSPRWGDYQLRYAYTGLPKTRLSLFVMGFDDKLLLSTPDEYAQGPDQDAQGDLSLHYFTHRVIGQIEHEFNDRLSLRVTPSVGWDFNEFGLGQSFRVEQDLYLVEVRTELPYTVNDHVQIVPGIDYIGGWYDFTFELPFNPDSFDDYDPLGEREDWGISDRGSVWGPDVYLKAHVRPFDDLDRLYLQPGIRYSYVNVYGQYVATGVDPRLAGRLRVLDKGYVKAAAGIYTQPPQATESYQPEGDYELGVERSKAYSLGYEQEILPGFTADVEGFYKDLDQLIVTNRDWESMADNAYTNEGIGTIYGGELMVRREPIGKLFGWVSYTWSRSERQDYTDCVEGSTACDPYLYDFDQTHILTGLAAYSLPFEIEVSGRVQYVTGTPYTPYSGAIYDADQETWTPFSTASRNSERLSPYLAVDGRVEKGFTFKRWRARAYVDLMNIYKGDNPEFRLYNYDYTEYVDVTGLPFVPSPGFEIEGYL